jgi:hypothetical protein
MTSLTRGTARPLVSATAGLLTLTVACGGVHIDDVGCVATAPTLFRLGCGVTSLARGRARQFVSATAGLVVLTVVLDALSLRFGSATGGGVDMLALRRRKDGHIFVLLLLNLHGVLTKLSGWRVTRSSCWKSSCFFNRYRNQRSSRTTHQFVAGVRPVFAHRNCGVMLAASREGDGCIPPADSRNRSLFTAAKVLRRRLRAPPATRSYA